MEKKIILVTGGNRGIGFAIAKGLSEQGHQVILSARKLEDAQRAVKELVGSVVAKQLDITDNASIEAIHKEIAEKYGKLDVLINNAGILIDFEDSIVNTNIEKVRQTFEVNTLGPLKLTKQFVDLLKKSGKGRVVNISSGMGQLQEMDGGLVPGYRISKTALNAVTKMFAAELVEDSIQVNSMCPGWVKTDMGGATAPRTPEQGADTAIWLATAEKIGTGKFYRDRKEIAW